MRSLDPCPECSTGTLVAYSTKRIRQTTLSKRYLRCDDPTCGFRGLQIVPQARQRQNTRAGKPLLNAAKGRGKMQTSRQEEDYVADL